MQQQSGTVLSNHDVTNICNYLNIPLLGVYTKDQLKDIPKKKGLYVFNLGDLSSGGTHWTAGYIYDGKTVYFDPFGSVPSIEIDQFIKSVSKKRIYLINKVQIQSLGSTYCGWYCIMFLYILCHSNESPSKSLDLIQDHFNSDNLNKNYDKLLSFFKKLIPK